MTALQFADATWWLPCLVVVFTLLISGDVRTWRWAFALAAMWIVAVAVIAVARG